MEDDAIYIPLPSRRRRLGFLLATISCLALVAGVWFQLMGRVIVEASGEARAHAAELNQIVEEFKTRNLEAQNPLESLGEWREFFVTPAPAVATETLSPEALEAVAAAIAEQLKTDLSAADSPL